MTKKDEKIELLSKLQEKLSPRRHPYHAGEMSIIRRILDEEEWKSLSDDEKQSRRKASVSLGKRWSFDPFIFTNHVETEADGVYQEDIVTVYDSITRILKKIELAQGDLDTDLQRVNAFFLIEKDFIDMTQVLQMDMHLPPEFFENLANTLDEKFPDLQLEKFSTLYSKMYENWSNKPKPIPEDKKV